MISEPFLSFSNQILKGYFMQSTPFQRQGSSKNEAESMGLYNTSVQIFTNLLVQAFPTILQGDQVPDEAVTGISSTAIYCSQLHYRNWVRSDLSQRKAA